MHRLAHVLKQHSFLHYLDLFVQQEVDFDTFVTLSADDLPELGITNQVDVKEMSTLICLQAKQHEPNHDEAIAQFETSRRARSLQPSPLFSSPEPAAGVDSSDPVQRKAHSARTSRKARNR